MQITRQTRWENLPDYLSIEEMRRYLGLGRSTAYALAAAGTIRSVKIGRRRMIPRSALRFSEDQSPS